jgi:hypothetical protein
MAAWVPAHAAGPLDAYYERSLMATAGARCSLFTTQISAALEAAQAQARSAALRTGRSEPEVQAVRSEATTRALATPCASRDLAVAAARVRSAFEGWSHVTRVTYPGADGGWIADRSVYRSAHWRLVETSGPDTAFGVAGDESTPWALAAVQGSAGGEAPYAARLKFRDPSRAPSPWLPRGGVDALPPPTALRTVFAEAKSLAGPGLGRGDAGATAFRFPASAAQALAGLDPRERFEVEFLYAHDRVRTAVFEVGDFAAGKAFLAMGPR